MDPQKGAGNDARDQQKTTNPDGRGLLQTLTNKPDDKSRLDSHHKGASTSYNSKATASASISSSNKTRPGNDAEMEVLRETADELRRCPDWFAIKIYVGLLFVIVSCIIGFFRLSWSWIIAIIAVFITFVVWRHISLKSEHPRPQTGRRWITRSVPPAPDTRGLPAVYFLYVLGSGGHTTEMLETIRRKWVPQANMHRRYIVTKDDKDSVNRVLELELQMYRCCPDERAGTRDSFEVTRARKVHQPFWTAPFTCLGTAIHAINALTSEPNARPTTRHGNMFKYPHVIITNGPATGFIVCLVAHLLKIFYLVPSNRLKMVYVESWARSRSLSLTGRLFLWTGIADLFGVQHEELARRVGPRAVYVGQTAAPLVPSG